MLFVSINILFLFYYFLVYCIDLRGMNVTKDEIIALTRDHFGRTNPDDLLNGFFPVWAVIQFCLSGTLFNKKKKASNIFILTVLGFFLVIALVSGVCYLLGCRSPGEERHGHIK